ncbi:hypothetical protein EN829_014890 [Mesorhizobium sp. M00.F.Ca.ET.186.01.1.1]|nr:hypothetical protein EN848_14545 [bacterium M00.F.Ca.ET.205.01.1.1]TGU52970.1 hypothetical protein EN795_14850 [bacterium M00.F.Ca.ET.152.01.1.1]TGV35940.1 hypothetical protein EN829_014890 [Mesorhizobium sp. M00.F.Ca.ET.186.01.1.1]TGZ43522.1 hypothetical protein EN805_10460 [bacterium M00.F.Ca.ET.162.01.1.1]
MENYAQADFSLSVGRASVRTMKDQTIEKTLRAIMAATGWKQQKLAAVLEVGQSTVNRWLVQGAEPEGHRRDRINELYSQVVENTRADEPIIGDENILAMLHRIAGLTKRDVDVAFTVISNALKANTAGSEQSDAGDRSQSATPRRESSSSR